jgi:cell wall-associated NlpC family hydrolase
VGRFASLFVTSLAILLVSLNPSGAAAKAKSRKAPVSRKALSQGARAKAADGKTQHKRKGKKQRKKRGHSQQARRSSAAVNPEKLSLPGSANSPVLRVASRYLGMPYRFGAASGAYDCSGFVRRVFEDLGVDLPHSARQQFSFGDRIHREELVPGDLVFFRTYRPGASHVGIYAGNDQFIHAATRAGQVQVDSLRESYYASRYLGARRIEHDS